MGKTERLLNSFENVERLIWCKRHTKAKKAFYKAKNLIKFVQNNSKPGRQEF
jgi:hypothetical protein